MFLACRDSDRSYTMKFTYQGISDGQFVRLNE